MPPLERETGFEPATSTLARLHSTAELFPLNLANARLKVTRFGLGCQQESNEIVSLTELAEFTERNLFKENRGETDSP
jgi:hypothetical protein